MKEIALSVLCELRISFVASQIRQVGPLQHQRADSGKPVRGRVVRTTIVEVEVVTRNARGCLKCKAKVVGKMDCLCKDNVDFARLHDHQLRLSCSGCPQTRTSSAKYATGPLSRS